MGYVLGAITTGVIIRWVHLLAAILWLGGMIFATFPLMPSLRGAVDPAANAMIVGRVVRRFRLMVGGSISLLAGTGILNTSWPSASASPPCYWPISSGSCRRLIAVCKGFWLAEQPPIYRAYAM
ncbi:MAG: hypothetical protein HYY30_07450 [Chloroflexi bacterium]|nr:hypothetical protein [Chloroflexota bacterium]